VIQYKTFKGSFSKHCPCSPGAISCGYHNINVHTGCPYECTYCILQVYLDSKSPVFYTNLPDLSKELAAYAEQHAYLRIGSGELSDSLAFDESTNYSSKMLKIVTQFPRVIFEFKTKSIAIKNILGFPEVLKNVVVSWSLNPQAIINQEEAGTPALKERLEAMARIQDRGYKIGIHMDPLIYTPDWKSQYENLVKLIAAAVRADKIAWWSLGALRFPPDLKQYILKHEHSNLFGGELIKGFDGKFRYFKPQRFDLFAFLIKSIQQQFSKEIPLYLCMEDEECWAGLLPHITPQEEFINRYLYESAYR